MSKFTEVLKNRNFFLLWVGQIISQLGDRLDQMALIGLVYARAPGSAMQIAKILSFTIIPVFLVGPIAGVYVDRWDRRRIMYGCDLLRAALVLLIPFILTYTQMLLPIYIVIFIVFSVGRFFVPAKLSIVPDLVDKKDLLLANSLVNTTGMIAAILGFGISGLVVEWLGAKSAFYLDSLSFLVSGILIFSITKKFNQRMTLGKMGRDIVEVIRKSVFQEIKEGVVYFVREKRIGFTAGLIFILWSALGAVYVIIIAFVQKTLKSATAELGLLIMFLGVGLFLGSLVYGRFGQKLSQYKTIFVSLILSGIMLVVFSFTINRYPVFRVAAFVSVVLGLFIAPIMIASNTIIHRVSENEMLGKIFSSMEIVMHFGFLLFMFVSSLLAESISKLSILVGVGCVLTVVGIGALVVVKAHD